MRTMVGAFTAILVCACLGWAQQTPPADGVGIGNTHLSPSGSASDVPSMSPDQNAVMTNSNGSVTGDKGISAFAGSAEESTATSANAQGPMKTTRTHGAAVADTKASQSVPQRPRPLFGGSGPPPIGAEDANPQQSSQSTNPKP